MTTLQRIVGTFFRSRINRLELAYAAASAPFYAEIANVERTAAEFQLSVEAGNAAWEETTEDGDHYDYGAELGERRDDAQEALLTLRKAFSFLIYHQWERTSQRWASGKAPNHEALVKGAKAAGILLDEPGLELLRLLVNTLKHNSGKTGPELRALRPDLFEASFNPDELHPVTGKPWAVIDWAEQIILTDANIEEFFGIVSRSVPA